MSSKVPPSINSLHKGERLIPIDFMPKLHPLVHHCYFSYYDVACAYQIHGEGVERHWANIRKDRSKGPGTKTIEGCPARSQNNYRAIAHKTPKTNRYNHTPSAATKAARRQASQNYRWKNEEELREKARVRMAARRKTLKDSGSVTEEHAARVKEASCHIPGEESKVFGFQGEAAPPAVRLISSRWLSTELTVFRAFIAKYGTEAYQERIKREQARADTAWEAKMAEGRVREEEARRERLARQQPAHATM
ncbi:hypothetical protein B0H14DRAFT_3539982 [Mycena olivaceomarginata]|nr:hypothetical protein B0H14DRAFT_3539982 [Mycena olivaceomarginata]